MLLGKPMESQQRLWTDSCLRMMMLSLLGSKMWNTVAEILLLFGPQSTYKLTKLYLMF